MITTITGANDYMRKLTLGQLVDQFVQEHSELALERFDGEEADSNGMRAALQSLPFLSSRKMVVLYAPSKQKEWIQHIATILDEIPSTADVILVEPKLDKRLSYYKTLKKVTDFRDCSELDTNGLASWAVKHVKAQGGSLSRGDARLLIDRVGHNQQLLASELDKLFVYAPHITGETIELLTEPMPQGSVFELLDTAFAGRVERMLQLYHEQRVLRVDPQAIIAMLAWQLHILALLKSAGERSTDDVARQAKLNPFVIRKSQVLARRISLSQIKRLITNLLTLDQRIKTTSVNPDEALQLYLLQIKIL